MSTDPRAPRMASIGALLLLGLACLLYLAMMHEIARSPSHLLIEGGEALAHGLQEEFDELVRGFLILLLWIVLAILLFLGRKGQKMPPQALVAAPILLPLSGVAAIYAAALHARYAGWAIVVPALLPPLIALYAMWMRLPVLHAALPAKIINAAAWGAILVLTIAPVPLSAVDASTYAAGEPERQRQREALLAANKQVEAQYREQEAQSDIARFQALNADSPLGDYLLDLSYPAARGEEALAKARQVKSRQSDVVALLEGGKIERLEDLWRLDIEGTPAVCTAYGDALHHEAANIGRYDPVTAYEWTLLATKVTNAVLRQLPNLKWLVGNGCDLDAVSTFVEARLRDYCGQCPASSSYHKEILVFLDNLAALRRPH